MGMGCVSRRAHSHSPSSDMMASPSRFVSHLRVQVQACFCSSRESVAPQLRAAKAPCLTHHSTLVGNPDETQQHVKWMR